MPIRFLGADGSGDLFASAKAIDYAVAQKAHIISASWGASVARSQIKPILEAIERAEKAGVVFVAAAANDGQSNDTTEVYPANAGLPNVISVAASNPQDQKPSWSNFGKHTVDLASPGEGILSTLPGNQYKNLSGTSMATPLVAGLVALMMAKAHEIHKPYSPAQIKAILQASGTTSDIETACQCRIDAYEALRHLTEQRLTLVPNTLSLQVHEQRSLNGMGGTAPYSFTSQDPEIIQVSPDGTLKAQALGETTVTVTDATGASVQSHTLFVHSGFSDGGDACPLQNPMMCAIICKIIPHMPWCKAPSLQGTSTYP
jgi:thermitase